MENLIKISALILITHLTLASYGQKGVNNPTGIARNLSYYEISDLEGRIIEIVDGPCQNTSGRSNSGTHLIVAPKDNQVEINVHLGPTNEVLHIKRQLSIGNSVLLKVFKTDDLKTNHFIAKELTIDNKTYELRDNNLRPFWAGKR